MHLKLSLSAHPRVRQKKILYSLLPCLTLLLLASLFATPTAQAAAAPGGRISDPVVRAVDIAKPAVVRIITTVNGRLTVHFNTVQSATFPLDGSTYGIQLSGSGAFISSNGDILTADHVIHPPHDKSMDQAIMEMAASDIATYINTNLSPAFPYTKEDVFTELYYGIFRSESTYTAPKSEVYLSQDYTGSYSATQLNTVPEYAHSPVTKIEKESAVDQKDVAIVHVNMTDTPALQLADSANVAQQDELTVIGFPGNGDIGNDPSKIDPNMLLTSSVNKIYVSSIKTGPNGQPLIQVGGNVEHGDSGGPALDSQGRIVGIVSFYSENADQPVGTSFLQASNSAQQLISGLAINTTPGRLERNWQHAFMLYASDSANHWHNAHQAFQQLATDYPKFAGLAPFVSYTGQQAQHEQLTTSTSNSNSINWVGILIAFIAVIAILVILGVIYIARRDRKRIDQAQTALAGTPVPFAYPTSPVSPEPTNNSIYAPSYQPPVEAPVVAAAPVAAATPVPSYAATASMNAAQPETPALGSAFAQQPSPAEIFARYRPTPLPPPRSTQDVSDTSATPEPHGEEQDDTTLDEATMSTAMMPAIPALHTAKEHPAEASAPAVEDEAPSSLQSADQEDTTEVQQVPHAPTAEQLDTVHPVQSDEQDTIVQHQAPAKPVDLFALPTYTPTPETDLFASTNEQVVTDNHESLEPDQKHAVPNGIEIPDGWYEGLEDIQKRHK